MNRVAAFIAVATLAAPAIAGTYSAKPVAAPTSAKIIGKDISWARDGDTYRGSTEASRPVPSAIRPPRKAPFRRLPRPINSPAPRNTQRGPIGRFGSLAGPAFFRACEMSCRIATLGSC
jgi:hypothetical protein